MADSLITKALPLRERLQASPASALRGAVSLRPEVIGAALAEPLRPRPIPAPPIVPLPPIAPPAPPPPALPPLSPDNPFNTLPRPSPGDRIRADDFRQLSSCLDVVQHAFVLAAALFGRPLGEARAFLAAEGLTIRRIVTVFGTVIDGPGDAAMDARRVVGVIPAPIGEPEVFLLVTEAVETRRLTPNLTDATHAEAAARLRAAIGEGTFPSAPVRVPPLAEGSLADAVAALAALATPGR